MDNKVFLLMILSGIQDRLDAEIWRMDRELSEFQKTRVDLTGFMALNAELKFQVECLSRVVGEDRE